MEKAIIPRRFVRKENAEVVVDRLSSLPEAIILHILGFVGARLAVQTSVLSKRWIHLWMYLPVLNIHSMGFPGGSSFQNFIRHFLERHSASTVHKLSFKIWVRLDQSLATMVMKHAMSRHVVEIDLETAAWYSTDFLEKQGTLGNKFVMTLKLRNVHITTTLNFPSLVSLTLDRVAFSCSNYYFQTNDGGPSPVRTLESLEFPFLKTLSLSNLRIGAQTNIDYVDLFSGFVSLENLEMSTCFVYSIGRFIITSPNLVNLKLSYLWFVGQKEQTKLMVCAPRLKNFSLKIRQSDAGFFLSMDNSTKLHDVHLHLMSPGCDSEFFSRVVSIFKAVSSTISLTLTMDTIEVLSKITDRLENQTWPLDNLETLKVQPSSEKNEVKNVQIPAQVMRYLLSCSSKLKELVVLPSIASELIMI